MIDKTNIEINTIPRKQAPKFFLGEKPADAKKAWFTIKMSANGR